MTHAWLCYIYLFVLSVSHQSSSTNSCQLAAIFVWLAVQGGVYVTAKKEKQMKIFISWASGWDGLAGDCGPIYSVCLCTYEWMQGKARQWCTIATTLKCRIPLDLLLSPINSQWVSVKLDKSKSVERQACIIFVLKKYFEWILDMTWVLKNHICWSWAKFLITLIIFCWLCLSKHWGGSFISPFT